jgi:thymidylate synthase (FAD)
MNVKMISYSQAPDANASESALDLVAYCARVSNPSNQNNTETNEKLVKYLMKHKHWSPLEMVSLCLEVETTRDIARQILRHRSFSFQEFSQRYADPTADLNFEIREARLQDTKNRQNSIPIDITDEKQRRIAEDWRMKQMEYIRQSQKLYTWAIENGIAKEQARAVLPEGNTVSRMYINGTLRSWVHFIELRSGNGTQAEHMDIAKAVAQCISEVFPMAGDFVSE